MSSISIVVADDYQDWRRTVRELLRERPELQVICEASDGLEAVQKAGELKPDLIVLDIGLPRLNGIEAARRIRQVYSNSKILFLTADNSPDVAQAVSSGWYALHTSGVYSRAQSSARLPGDHRSHTCFATG